LEGSQLIRINHAKIECGQQTVIEHGDMISILLPWTKHDAGILKLQFTFVVNENAEEKSTPMKPAASPQRDAIQHVSILNTLAHVKEKIPQFYPCHSTK
jgi:hypothetical protein